MLRKLSVLIIFLFFSVMPRVAFAQATNTTSTNLSTQTPTVQNTTAQTFKQTKQETKAQLQQARQTYKTALATIKDARKKAIVENIDTKIQTLNADSTKEMGLRLSMLSLVLTHISTNEATLASQNVDTSLLQTDIANAQSAIDTAQQAVTAQSQKDYVIDITTEDKLGPAVKTTLLSFRIDLKNVYLDVVSARKAVVTAHEEMLKLKVNTNGASTTPEASAGAVTNSTP